MPRYPGCGYLPVVLLAALISRTASAEWSARALPAGQPGGPRCVLESARQPIFDGYNDSEVRIEIDGSKVILKSASVLDPGSSDIALSVDRHAPIAVDRIDGGRSAVFHVQYAAIVDQFVHGRTVKFTLRFWPTWPATGVHEATFSLIGFTKAHGNLANCKPE